MLSTPGQPAWAHAGTSAQAPPHPPAPRGNLDLRPRPSLAHPTLALGISTGHGDSRCSTSGHTATWSAFTQHNSFFQCPSFSLPSCNPGQTVYPQISGPCSWGLAGQWLGLLGAEVSQDSCEGRRRRWHQSPFRICAPL